MTEKVRELINSADNEMVELGITIAITVEGIPWQEVVGNIPWNWRVNRHIRTGIINVVPDFPRTTTTFVQQQNVDGTGFRIVNGHWVKEYDD